MTYIDLLGYTGAIMSCLMVAPQAVKTVRQRKDPHALAGVSLLAMCCVIANATIWAVWAVLSKSYPAGIPSLINGPAAVVAVIAILRWRGKEVAAPESRSDLAESLCGCGWTEPTKHILFVTARPGYGTILPCPGQPVRPSWGRIVSASAVPEL